MIESQLDHFATVITVIGLGVAGGLILVIWFTRRDDNA